MARKICTAGAIGSISFMVLDTERNGVVASIRNDSEEITARYDDVDQATNWAERKIRELIGKRYEDN